MRVKVGQDVNVVEIEDNNNSVAIRLYKKDFYGYLKPVREVSVPMFFRSINLSDRKQMEENAQRIRELFASYLDGRYPLLPQREVLEDIIKNPLFKSCIKEYCQNSCCLCPLFFSIGCVESLNANVRQTKLFKSLFNAVSMIFTPAVAIRLLSRTAALRGEQPRFPPLPPFGDDELDEGT